MTLSEIKAVYFIGAGGIGMSAIARYFLRQGLAVAGYDKTPSELTRRLTEEGADIHYVDDVDAIPEVCRHKESTLVIYTPAIPESHKELQYFRSEGFEIEKRAQVLGTITRAYRALCVAGTHGKTTTSAMCAHILHQSHVDCNAFLGGITKNYGTNYLLADSQYVVIEADEFDRSFHWLQPWATVITATDPDHLDIYGTKEAYLESFSHYTTLIREGGALVMHTGLEMKACPPEGVRTYTYSRNEGDFHAENIVIADGEISFDLVSPIENVPGIFMGHPVPINIDNGIAAMALAQLAGCSADELREGMRTFQGVDRRFDFRVRNSKHVVLSDYAHHPAEIEQSLRSLRQLYAGRRITALFQPHLYTRTRDFYTDFAHSLSMADEVILTEIYPARELPIEGVTSQLIYDNLAEGVQKTMTEKAKVLEYLNRHDTDVLVVLGAGDLDNMMDEITLAATH